MCYINCLLAYPEVGSHFCTRCWSVFSVACVVVRMPWRWMLKVNSSSRVLIFSQRNSVVSHY